MPPLRVDSYAVGLTKQNPEKRYLAWALVEKGVTLTEEQLLWLRDRAREVATPIVWAFSGPDDVSPVVLSVGLVEEARPAP